MKNNEANTPIELLKDQVIEIKQELNKLKETTVYLTQRIDKMTNTTTVTPEPTKKIRVKSMKIQSEINYAEGLIIENPGITRSNIVEVLKRNEYTRGWAKTDTVTRRLQTLEKQKKIVILRQSQFNWELYHVTHTNIPTKTREQDLLVSLIRGPYSAKKIKQEYLELYLTARSLQSVGKVIIDEEEDTIEITNKGRKHAYDMGWV